MAKVAVTGGTGFIGRQLVSRLLSLGHSVRVLCRAKLERPPLPAGVWCVNGDVGEAATLRPLLEGTEAVFHLAAGTQGEWPDYYRSTVEGTSNVLRAAEEYAVGRVVYVSSSGVYRTDGLPRGAMIEESSPLETALARRTYYIRAKLLAEDSVLKAMAEGKTAIVNLRPALVYGPGNAYCAVLFPTLKGILTLGLGSPRRQVALVYIEDLIDALIAAWEKAPRGEIYNIGDDASPSYREYHDTYHQLAGRKQTVLYVPYAAIAPMAALVDGLNSLRNGGERVGIAHRLRAFCGDVRFSSRKAMSQLGWSAKVPFAAGMRRAMGLTAEGA